MLLIIKLLLLLLKGCCCAVQYCAVLCELCCVCCVCCASDSPASCVALARPQELVGHHRLSRFPGKDLHSQRLPTRNASLIVNNMVQ